jgi:hypothetical protein
VSWEAFAEAVGTLNFEYLVGKFIQISLIVLVLSVILGWVGQKLVDVLHSLLNFPATLLAQGHRGFRDAAPYLDGIIGNSTKGLAEEGAEEEGRRVWIGWYIIGPLIYLAFFLVFLLSDLLVAYLVFERLGFVNPASSAGVADFLYALPLDLAMAILLASLAAFFGLAIFDLNGSTPLSFLWSRLSPEGRQFYRSLAGWSFGILLFTGALMGVWRIFQLQPPDLRPEPWNTYIPWLFSAGMVALTFFATYLSFKPIAASLTALLIIGLFILWAVCKVVAFALRTLVLLVRVIFRVVFALIDLLARPGRTIWNWLVRILPKGTRLGEIDELQRPGEDLGGDLDDRVPAGPPLGPAPAGLPAEPEPVTSESPGGVRPQPASPGHGLGQPVGVPAAVGASGPTPSDTPGERLAGSGGTANDPADVSSNGHGSADVAKTEANAKDLGPMPVVGITNPSDPRPLSDLRPEDRSAVGDALETPPKPVTKKKCWSCGAENPVAAKFCDADECGEPLGEVCLTSDCRFSLRPGKRICGECGRRTETPGSPMSKRADEGAVSNDSPVSS